MLDFIYKTLASLGFEHPLHPIITHVSMGMIFGGFLFKLASFKWKELSKTSYHCLVLALIFAPPTIIVGIMDWQYRYAGVVNGPILAKIILSFALIILLSLTVYLNHSNKVGDKINLLLYSLCLITAVGLGYIGGVLIYG